MHKYLIFGGTGFIGSHLTQLLLSEPHVHIDIASRTPPQKHFWLNTHRGFNQVQHHCCDLYDHQRLSGLLSKIEPDTVVFSAGENPSSATKADELFVHNNVINFYYFLQQCLHYYQSLSVIKQQKFKLLNISTYEIFNLNHSTNKSKKHPIIQPKTLYSASKASAFHLANAWHKTYGLPIVNAICVNNYGQNQGNDKLIPMTINNLQHNKPIQLFDNGQCQRNWIHVEDTAEALLTLAKKGRIGHTYPLGSDDFIANKQLVDLIVSNYAHATEVPVQKLQTLINITKQQKAYSHHCDYAKMNSEFGWKPQLTLENSLKKITPWYIKQHHV